jgi:hypothetical protein
MFTMPLWTSSACRPVCSITNMIIAATTPRAPPITAEPDVIPLTLPEGTLAITQRCGKALEPL